MILFTMLVDSNVSSPLSIVFSSIGLYTSSSSSFIFILPQLLQVASSISLISFTKPTCITGMASSICPKWPGHSSTFPLHVLHLRPGSITPIWRSIRPLSSGKPSSSYVSAVVTLTALIFLISSGERSAKFSELILFLISSPIILDHPAVSSL